MSIKLKKIETNERVEGFYVYLSNGHRTFVLKSFTGEYLWIYENKYPVERVVYKDSMISMITEILEHYNDRENN